MKCDSRFAARRIFQAVALRANCDNPHWRRSLYERRTNAVSSDCECGPSAFEKLVQAFAKTSLRASEPVMAEDELVATLSESDNVSAAVKFVAAMHFDEGHGDPQAFSALTDGLLKFVGELVKSQGPALLDLLSKYLQKRFGMSAQSADSTATGCLMAAALSFVQKKPTLSIVLDLLTCLAQAGLAHGGLPGVGSDHKDDSGDTAGEPGKPPEQSSAFRPFPRC